MRINKHFLLTLFLARFCLQLLSPKSHMIWFSIWLCTSPPPASLHIVQVSELHLLPLTVGNISPFLSVSRKAFYHLCSSSFDCLRSHLCTSLFLLPWSFGGRSPFYHKKEWFSLHCEGHDYHIQKRLREGMSKDHCMKNPKSLSSWKRYLDSLNNLISIIVNYSVLILFRHGEPAQLTCVADFGEQSMWLNSVCIYRIWDEALIYLQQYWWTFHLA